MAKGTKSVDEYIAERPKEIQELLRHLQHLVDENLPDAEPGMKWGAPVFINRHGVPVIYLYGGSDHANLGFVHGAGLKDPEKLLAGKGVAGRHVKTYPDKPIPEQPLIPLIKQCGDLR